MKGSRSCLKILTILNYENFGRTEKSESQNLLDGHFAGGVVLRRKALAQTNNVGGGGQFHECDRLGNITVIGKLDQGAGPDHSRPRRDGLHASAGPDRSRSPRATTRRSTRSSCARRAWRRIRRRTAICTCAASTRTCNTASTTCCCRKASPALAWSWTRALSKSMQLITGSLPAQYGFRTAGVVDIQTKSGAFENGGGADLRRQL